MATLLKHGRIEPDTWQPLEGGVEHWVSVGEDGLVPDFPEDADLLVPLALLRARRDDLLERRGRTGVLLEPHEDLRAIAPDLERLAQVALRFPKFSDGRPYSSAKLLRSRYGYRGELRAVGEVLRDHLLFMQRCGFDAMVLRADQDPQDALAALAELPVQYQIGKRAA
jgi:uncharacterized protein (DUF934 family)